MYNAQTNIIGYSNKHEALVSTLPACPCCKHISVPPLFNEYGSLRQMSQTYKSKKKKTRRTLTPLGKTGTKCWVENCKYSSLWLHSQDLSPFHSPSPASTPIVCSLTPLISQRNISPVFYIHTSQCFSLPFPPHSILPRLPLLTLPPSC